MVTCINARLPAIVVVFPPPLLTELFRAGCMLAPSFALHPAWCGCREVGELLHWLLPQYRDCLRTDRRVFFLSSPCSLVFMESDFRKGTLPCTDMFWPTSHNLQVQFGSDGFVAALSQEANVL